MNKTTYFIGCDIFTNNEVVTNPVWVYYFKVSFIVCWFLFGMIWLFVFPLLLTFMYAGLAWYFKKCSSVYLFVFRHFYVLCCSFSVFNIYIYGSHCGCNYQEISTSILLDLCQQVRHPIINSPFLCQHITHIYTYVQIYLLIYMLVDITLSFC